MRQRLCDQDEGSVRQHLDAGFTPNRRHDEGYTSAHGAPCRHPWCSAFHRRVNLRNKGVWFQARGGYRVPIRG
jgi:hypothetical protein